MSSRSYAHGFRRLTPADAAIFETFVVPRYLSLYGDLALEMFLVGDAALTVCGFGHELVV